MRNIIILQHPTFHNRHTHHSNSIIIKQFSSCLTKLSRIIYNCQSVRTNLFALLIKQKARLHMQRLTPQCRNQRTNQLRCHSPIHHNIIHARIYPISTNLIHRASQCLHTNTLFLQAPPMLSIYINIILRSLIPLTLHTHLSRSHIQRPTLLSLKPITINQIVIRFRISNPRHSRNHSLISHLIINSLCHSNFLIHINILKFSIIQPKIIHLSSIIHLLFRQRPIWVRCQKSRTNNPLINKSLQLSLLKTISRNRTIRPIHKQAQRQLTPSRMMQFIHLTISHLHLILLSSRKQSPHLLTTLFQGILQRITRHIFLFFHIKNSLSEHTLSLCIQSLIFQNLNTRNSNLQATLIIG